MIINEKIDGDILSTNLREKFSIPTDAFGVVILLNEKMDDAIFKMIVPAILTNVINSIPEDAGKALIEKFNSSISAACQDLVSSSEEILKQNKENK